MNLIAIPLAFAAGAIVVMLAQFAGLVQVLPSDESPDTSVSSSLLGKNPVNSGLIASDIEQVESRLQQLNDRADQMQQQLQDNTLTSDRMQVQVSQLQEQLETALTEGALFADTGTQTGDDTVIQPIADAESNAVGRARGFGGAGNDIEYTSLVAAGIDPVVAEELKRQNDQWTLQRLELVDQATREGWRRSDEFGERMRELREQQPDIRAEVGDENYDRYLYAAGDSNRVQVSSIIDGSAAQLAGLENGDVVLSYADERVFSMRELQRATSEGSRGESIQVQVLRNGELMSVDLPRGPLGVTLSGIRTDPGP